MPIVLRRGGFRFGFFAADAGEPPHVHVSRQSNEAKYWLDPISLQRNRGFATHELTRIEKILQAEQQMLIEAWHDYFGRGQGA